jgi:hypothetical protein
MVTAMTDEYYASLPEDRSRRRSWREWMLTAPSARLIAGALVVADGIAMVAAASLVVTVAVRGRALPGTSLVLATGVPLAFAGQICPECGSRKSRSSEHPSCG